jgi:hypothetical protein
MRKLTLADLADPIAYERERSAFRARIIALKQNRRVPVGDCITLVFENRETARFQIQEMCRVEQLVEPEALQAEVDVYNTLIPDDGELSATFLVELDDAQKIRALLDRLVGVNETVFLEVDGNRIQARFDPGTYREDRVAAVHYLRFRLTPEAVQAFKSGGREIALLIDHPNYRGRTVLSGEVRRALAEDLG